VHDFQLVMDSLASYLWPKDERHIEEWMYSGVSLGGEFATGHGTDIRPLDLAHAAGRYVACAPPSPLFGLAWLSPLTARR
jgi:hypothetical protein